MVSVWENVLALLASIGGAGVLVWAVVKFAAKKIADGMFEKYKHTLERDLTEMKADLENRNHSYQAKFDKEFKIYGELVVALLCLKEKMGLLFVEGMDHPPADEGERQKFYQTRYEAAIASFEQAEHAYGEYLIFMPQEICSSIRGFLESCRIQCIQYHNWYCYDMANPRQTLESFNNGRRMAKTTNAKYDALIQMLREYISKQLQ